jgi:hypothetical protein
VTAKWKEKDRARLLQERTGLSYSECLRCVRAMTPEEVEVSLRVIEENTPGDYSILVEITSEAERDKRSDVMMEKSSVVSRQSSAGSPSGAPREGVRS